MGSKSNAINLNYHGLTEIDFKEEKYSGIKCIYLKRNLLKTLSPGVSRLHCLVELHVASNSLESLPAEIGDLPKLEILDVSDNYISSLPLQFEYLKSLKKLRIADNNFQSFPNKICQLENLQVLEASRNNFRTIPEGLSQCTNLRLLAVDKNSLRYIPRQLCRLQELEELSLCGNKLNSLPHCMRRMRKLKSLNLDNNPLLALPLSLSKKDFCSVGLYGCQPFHTQEYINKNLQNILPIEMSEVLINGQGCVPCLQELAARQIVKSGIYDNCTVNSESLPLPFTWIDRLVNPPGLCDRCLQEIFMSSFPVIFEDESENIQYYGLFCSDGCVKFYRKTSALKTIFPKYEDG